MPIEPTNKIYGTLIIRRKENEDRSPRKRPKKEKRESEKGGGKIDIKV